MLGALLANGANGMSDIEGKAATEAVSECGATSEFQWSRGDASDIDGRPERVSFGRKRINEADGVERHRLQKPEGEDE